MYAFGAFLLLFAVVVDCQRPFGVPFGSGGRFFGDQGRPSRPGPFGGIGPNGGEGGRPFGGFGENAGGLDGSVGVLGGEGSRDTPFGGFGGGRPFRPFFRPFVRPRPPFGGPFRRIRSRCPMVPGLKDPKAFFRICFNSTNPCEFEDCGEEEACCPTNLPDGVCRWQCQTTVDPKPKAGQCASDAKAGEADAGADGADGADEDGSSETDDFMPLWSGLRPHGPKRRRWVKGFCDFAIKNDKASPIECRHDGDCSGTQKCCSPEPNPNNFIEMCKRECIDV